LLFFYGVAQEDDKEQFLLDLGKACSGQDFSLIVGSDFNLLKGMLIRTKP
jgi:hypothetical protein